jgi:hypothetical protein
VDETESQTFLGDSMSRGSDEVVAFVATFESFAQRLQRLLQSIGEISRKT